MKDYLELTKPNVTWLILMSTAVGFYLGSRQIEWWLLAHVMIGTALVASGTAALNQWMERAVDGRMRRTRNRPLPAGRLGQRPAFFFGLALAAGGAVYLAVMVNLLTASLGAFTCSSYLLCYTPLKSRSVLATLVGAFPGAMPILMGWTAATGRLGLEGWVLYGILFFWQFPHFLAIAALYKEDYQRGGIRVPDIVSTGRQVVTGTLALLALSVVPTLLGVAGAYYGAGALALGCAFLYFGIGIARRHTALDARRLLQASVVYLPLVYVLMVVDKV